MLLHNNCINCILIAHLLHILDITLGIYLAILVIIWQLTNQGNLPVSPLVSADRQGGGCACLPKPWRR